VADHYTERNLREWMATTKAGQRWRERYLKDLESRRLREAAIAKKVPTKDAPCEVCSDPKIGREKCVVHGAEGHQVPERSFVDDVKRKVKARRVMPGGPLNPKREAARAMEAFHSEYHDTPVESLDSFVGSTLAAAMVWREADQSDPSAQPSGADDLGMGDDNDRDQPVDKAPYDKEEVNYQYASDPARSCGGCAYFVAPASCAIVNGMILKADTCDKFEEATR
jgi:hypothetical protein